MYATVRERQKLLRWLDAPVGALTVSRKKSEEDDIDILVVRMSGGYSVPESKRMPRFDGFPVEYREETVVV